MATNATLAATTTAAAAAAADAASASALATADDVAKLLLSTLDTQGEIASARDLRMPSAGNSAASEPVPVASLLAAISSLEIREMICVTATDLERLVLTAEGAEVAMLGSHEARVYNAIPASEGLAVSELAAAVGPASAQIGQGKAFKNKWIAHCPTQKGRLVRAVAEIQDETALLLRQIRDAMTQPSAAQVADLRKRKLVGVEREKNFSVKKGPKFATDVIKQITELTADMVLSGSWRSADFKPYNLNARGVPPEGGCLHPLMKVREEFRRIFFELGFEEMATNQFVESSFWNFDVLFQPQQHPSRDMHDTFFLKNPATAKCYPQDVMENVRRVHSVGDYGSIGYRYEWKEAEAEKLVLRTHTTAVSANMLYRLAQECKNDSNNKDGFRAVKLFSIDRVFRNEAVDATHLAEFHQIEGVVADTDMSLSHLVGIISEFFKKAGVTGELRFKPAYNPYTEPSLEIFAFHAGLDRWVEVGNSGVFRPEFLRPMGVPENVRVLGWGLSLERPTMIKYGIDNIRELLGDKCDLRMFAKNPICRLDK